MKLIHPRYVPNTEWVTVLRIQVRSVSHCQSKFPSVSSSLLERIWNIFFQYFLSFFKKKKKSPKQFLKNTDPKLSKHISYIKSAKEDIFCSKQTKKYDKQLSRLLRAEMKTRFSLIVVAVGSRFGGRTIRGGKEKKKKSTQHFLRGARISDQTPECWVLKKQTGNLEKSSRGCSESKTSSWRGYKCNPYSTALTLNFICDCFSIVWSTNKRQAATTTTTKKEKSASIVAFMYCRSIDLKHNHC